jgi:predicted NAD/FAD-dependent oxidoreductase
MVVHASADWSDRHLESDAGEVQRMLQHAFGELTGIDAARASHAALHRWRYALLDPETATGAPFLSLAEGLGATGDWCSASRVEDAWHAGRRLAADILAGLDGMRAGP